MELKQIKELMAAMERAGIKKLSVKETTGFELQLERHEEVGASTSPMALSPHHPMYPPAYHSHPFVGKDHEHVRPSSPIRSAEQEPALEKREEKQGKFITSPIVGTFYASPSPDDPAFVKVGDPVDEDTIVCIIEAMKVMNEVKAGVSGTVAEILVDNAHPVEFGSKMFRVV